MKDAGVPTHVFPAPGTATEKESESRLPTEEGPGEGAEAQPGKRESLIALQPSLAPQRKTLYALASRGFTKSLDVSWAFRLGPLDPLPASATGPQATLTRKEGKYP